MLFDRFFKQNKFKQIPDHPNYGISKRGEICNLKTDYILKPMTDRTGNLRIKLDGKLELISNLVESVYGRKG